MAIKVVNFTSIDGVIQSPLGEDGLDAWVPPYVDDAVEAHMSAATTAADGLLLGRRTYELLRAAWEPADQQDPAVAAMNRMPKHVLTSRSDGLTWANSHRVGLDEVGEHEGDLTVLGSGSLVRALAERDLVDAYELLVFPVVLGRGRRMFDETGALVQFRLAGSTTTEQGVVILTYVRATT